MRAFMRLRWSAILALGSVFSCTGSSPSIEARPVALLGSRLHASTSPAPVAVEDDAAKPWLRALRVERWDEAARSMDLAGEKERAEPGFRFARARVASELRDYERVKTALADLEPQLPALAPEIAELRAGAELHVGPFPTAAAYYAKKLTADGWLKAATAYEHAGNPSAARAAVERALVALNLANKSGANKETRDQLGEAHAVRARLAEAAGDKRSAALELRWLAKSVPTSPLASEADTRLALLWPAAALSRSERLERARSMADEGLVEATDRELELLDKAPGAPIKNAELMRTRGMARYLARRDYAQASELLAKAAETGSADPAHDLFYAARALSRAQNDDRAIELYQALAQRYPRSGWAEDARFLTARLTYIAGRWPLAAERYTSYLSRYGKAGKYADSARYERAIAWLAAKDPKAVHELQSLSEQSDDERVRARLLELQGAALLQAGQVAPGAELLERAVREQPLSFASMAASARLRTLGREAPPPLKASSSVAAASALSPRLPARAELLHALGLDGDAERELAREQAALARAHAPRSAEALCQAFGRLSSAAERYRIGQRAARPEALDFAPTSASRWLWECVYPRPYAPAVSDATLAEALPENLVYAVMRQESAFRSRVVSPAGAIGLMQLMSSTAERVATELDGDFTADLLTSPAYNVKLGAHYLKKLLDTFAGNVALTAAAYNAGPQAVSRWLESGEALPLDVFVARIPYDETRAYVERVVGNLARYAYLYDGETAVPALELELKPGLRAAPDAY